ncbi:MAG: gliding motility-associated C-terminal domain-containing protein [Flavobacteriales bacterium]
MKRLFYIGVLLVLSISSRAQLGLGPDISFCAGDSATLTANGTYSKYTWSNGATGASIKVKNSGTYIVTAYSTGTSSNLVVNGDFEAGNTGFTSAYTYDPVTGQQIGEGKYSIDNNPKDANWDFQECTDHTSGSGNMLVANGTKTLNQKLWCQTVAVDPNTNYDFSTSVGSATKDFPAIMQFSINNIAIGSTFNASATPCTWNTFNQAWNSGVNTSAQICIINKNVSSKGNDFILDDIVFTKTDTVKVYDTIIVTVNPKPVVDLGTDKSICAGASTTLDAGTGYSVYNWSNGDNNSSISVSAAGTYSVDVTDNKGCKASDAISVTSSSQLSFSVGKDTTVCGGTASLTLNAGAGYSTYSWSGGGNSATKTVSSSGQYIVNATSSGGCSGADTINVTFNPAINLSFPNDSESICNGGSTVLNPAVSGGAGGFTYAWSGAGSGNGTSYTAASVGNYILTVTDSKGCIANGNVNVTSAGSISLSLGNDTTLCGGAAGLTLDAGSGFTTYAWSGGGNSQTKIVSTSGQYIVTVSSSSCSKADTINVNFNPAITVTFPAGANSVCNGNSVVLTPTVSGGSGGFTYAWSGAASGSNASFTAMQAGTYSLTATDRKGCKASATKTLSQQSLSVSLLGGKDSASFCSGSSITLDPGTHSGYTYLWSNKATTQSIKVNKGGTYYLIASSGNCNGTDTVTIEEITVPKNPLADQSIFFCFKERDFLPLSAGISDTNYTIEWNTGETTNDIDASKEGLYSLKISRKQCETQDQIQVIDYCETTVFVPNCFTPNGDHHNDEFKPAGRNLENFELLIFNRWGELIFSSNNADEGWNGSYKGQPVEEDVYVWKLSYSVDQKSGRPLQKEQIGHVVLFK